jgi:hypothetical protein
MACIGLTSAGAYAVTRVAVDRGLSLTFPKMSRANRAGIIGIAGFAASYGLIRLSWRMSAGNAQYDHANMYHLGKDNIVPFIAGAGMCIDAWRIMKSEKKKDFRGNRR